MDQTTEFVLRHGYSLLFLWVAAEQIGLPLPAVPILLAAGALAGQERMSFLLAVAVAGTASLLADSFWYLLGRLRGGKVLAFLCKLALEKDTCVRKTENLFARHGAKSLLVAKFIPGFNTAAPPLAGAMAMSYPRFLLWSAGGAALWVGSFAGLGMLFSDQLEDVARLASRLGGYFLAILLGSALAAFIAWKWWERRRFREQVRTARVSPEEVRERLAAGEKMFIIDLRHPLDFLTDPRTLPGALRIQPQEVEQRQQEIPRDQDVILYCT